MASDVIIRIRDNGPILIEGDAKILDADGNEFPRDPNRPSVAICRCGQSAGKPFCDGSHRSCGFASSERASG